MKRGFARILTVTAAMVSMLSIGMTASAAENYTVAQGDYLMKIAQNKYGDEEKWNVIYEANKEGIKDPTKIYPGQVIVIPDLMEVPATAEIVAEPEAAPAQAVTVTEVEPAPELTVTVAEVEPAPAVEITTEAAPAPSQEPEVTTPAPSVETGMTLEEYYKDPEFKKELDSEMAMFDGYGMDLSIAFQGNTMAVIVKITDSSYMVDGLGEMLSAALEEVSPMVEELVAVIENELGNPGNCVVIYSYQTMDGTTIAQKAYTAK